MPPAPADIQARVETDLDTTHLQALIDEAVADIEDRYGPYRSTAVPPAPIQIMLEGRRRMLEIMRPLDDTQAVSITEYITADPRDVEFSAYVEDWWPMVGEVATVLAADDYRVWHSGRTLERLFTGTNPRVFWGSRVQISYVPVDDTARRDEVVIKLVILGLAYQGVLEQRVGEVMTTFGPRTAAGGGSPILYQDEREKLLKTLEPRRGLMLL